MYNWALTLEDTPLCIKMVHELAHWELQMLQLRFTLCEYVETAKWQHCCWSLDMGGREVLNHRDCVSLVRPWMGQAVTAVPNKLRLHVHEEAQLQGDQFCASEISLCIPMPLLFQKLTPVQPPHSSTLTPMPQAAIPLDELEEGPTCCML